MRRQTKSAIMGVLSVIVMIFGCPGVLIGANDIACSATINQWLPLYPGAEVVETEYNFIRPRASGLTNMTLSTPDEAESVREFYRQNIISLMREAASRGAASTDWQVEENEQGTGSFIYLSSRCGQF